MVGLSALDDSGQVEQGSATMRRDPLRLSGQFIVLDPGDEPLEENATLEPCHRGAEAVVDTVAEAEVSLPLPTDVEIVGIRPSRLVAVRRPVYEQSPRTLIPASHDALIGPARNQAGGPRQCEFVQPRRCVQRWRRPRSVSGKLRAIHHRLPTPTRG